MFSRFAIISLFVAFVVTMPVEPEQPLVGGKRVPHPNSAAGQELANKDLSGFTGGSSVPHPNSAAGQALAKDSGFTGGAGVPHPNSEAGQALSEKSVLEGGTQVKPWLKNQPNLAEIREAASHQQQQ